MATSTPVSLSLIISGTQNVVVGLAPLVTVGVFPAEEGNHHTERPLLDERFVHTIRHGLKAAVYSLYDNRVRPYGSSRSGLLVISIAIPRGKQLSGDLSPHTLLQEVYHTFVAVNMYASADGSHIFKESEYDSAIFKGLLGKYLLKDTTEAYMPMPPIGERAVVNVDSDEKLSMLMRDSQYPEFHHYSCVEIGRQCASTVKIEIPRRREYKVMLNGMNVKTLKSYAEKFNSEDYLHDSEYNTYIGQHVEFTLQELIAGVDGSMFDGRVKLNGDTIECTVKEKAKEFLLKAEIKAQSGTLSEDDRDNVMQLLKNGNIRVMFGKDDISRAFYTYDDILVRGADIKSQVYLSPESYGDYTFTVEKRKEQKKIILFVKKNKKPEPKPESAYDRPSTGGGKKGKVNLLIGLGAGLVIGGALCYFFTGNPEGNRLSSEQQEKIESLQQEILNLQQENNELKNENADLKNQQDTQDPSDVPGNPEGQAPTADSNNNQPQTNEQPPAEDYRSQIVEAVNDRNWGKLEGKNGLLAKAVRKGQITSDQRIKIESLWWKNGGYKKAERAIIDNALKGKLFKSIDEIVESAETIPDILK